MTCLVDTDTLLYTACYGSKGDFIQTIELAEIYREQIEQLGPCRHFLSGPNNFRYKVAKTLPYKGNRSKREKPRYYTALKEYMASEWGAEYAFGCEADDMIGINHTPGETIIVTNDKDLKQIPGTHYNWKTQEMFDVSERDGWFYFYKQLLTGDTADNIPGVPGIGDKTAADLLLWCDTVDDMEHAVKACYREVADKAANGELIRKKPIPETYKDWEAKYEEAYRLLYILRKQEELDQINAELLSHV